MPFRENVDKYDYICIYVGYSALTLFRDILGMVTGVCVKSISISSDMVSVHSLGNAVVPVSDVCNFDALLMRRLFNTMRPITTKMELNSISTTMLNSKHM